MPMRRMRCRGRSPKSLGALYEPVVIAGELGYGIATKLAQRLARKHQGRHGLRDHAHGRDGRDVGALLERDRLRLGRDIDGLQDGTVEGCERLHGGSSDQEVAGRHSALDPPCAGGFSLVSEGIGIPSDRVVNVRYPPTGKVEAIADFDSLYGLDAHERLGQKGVELAVPMDMAAEANR